MASPDRPNILFAIADDASHFSAYGHEFVKTPSFDRVAREGVLFQNMFTTNPKCAPSRASILTGRHTWQLKEACTHFCVFPGAEEFTVYPDLLEEAGYHVGYTGKGWGPGDWERRGRTRNPAGPEYSEYTLTPPEESGIKPCDYAANFDAFLADRPDDKPFYFWYGGMEPHRAYEFGEGLRHGKSLDEVKRIPPYWPQEDVVRQDMLDYAFEVEWFDRHLGLMLRKLEEIGELDNTLVIVTSDNGCPFPRVKGQMYDDDFRLPFAAMWRSRMPGKRTVDDLASFIDIMPTFLEVAGIDVPAELPGRSLTDLFFAQGSGTVTDYRDRAVMGKERHDVGRENDAGYPVRCIRTPRYMYARNYEPDRWPAGNPETGYRNCDASPTKSRILELHEKRQDENFFQLSFGKRPAEELYDIKKDPFCLTNLADKPELADVKNRLRRELDEQLERSEDPRFFGDGDVFDTYEYVGDPPHSWKNYLKRNSES